MSSYPHLAAAHLSFVFRRICMSSTARRITRAGVIACGLTLATLTAPAPLDAQNTRPAQPQKIDAEYTAKIKEFLQDPRITTELVDHLPGVRHRAHAAQVSRPHRRAARRAHLREGHPSLLRGHRQGLRPRADVVARQERRRPRHGAARDRRRSDDQAAVEVQGHARAADRSAEDDRCAGAATA